MAFPVPLVLTPALPSELLSWVLQHEAYPTTLIICYPRADFLSSLISDVRRPTAYHLDEEDDDHQTKRPPQQQEAAAAFLLSTRLYQVAVARHIRIAFTPTVSHLRAYLSAFQSTDHSKVPPPPSPAAGAGAGATRVQGQSQPPPPPPSPPLLLVYGFLALHRDTSEWSAQGLSATAAALVETSRTSGLRAILVEPPKASLGAGLSEDENKDEEMGAAQGVSSNGATVTVAASAAVGDQLLLILAEEMPVLSASVVRAGGAGFDEAAWTGRKVTAGRVLGRWFRYKARQWPSAV